MSAFLAVGPLPPLRDEDDDEAMIGSLLQIRVEFTSRASCAHRGGNQRSLSLSTLSARPARFFDMSHFIHFIHLVHLLQRGLDLVPGMPEGLPVLVVGRRYLLQAGQEQRVLGHSLHGHLQSRHDVNDY